MTTIQSLLIAIVEGLTEFLPISSTGHMIIAEKLLGIPATDFTKLFTVAIQLGAILAVVVLYWKKFFNFKNWQFYVKLMVGVIPALVFGLLFSKKIDLLLESALTVAISLLLGGVVLLFIERFLKTPSVSSEKEVGFMQAAIIGLWQCIAMVPGVSRSAASIIGGMQQKLTRNAAAEFSFFLAVPTMLAATGYKLLKHFKESGGFSENEIQQLAIGNLVAFIVAILAIKLFIGFLKKYGFRIWGIYRIIAGVIMLLLIWQGIIK
jgi:undecaprenyl-diphosphatase